MAQQNNLLGLGREGSTSWTRDPSGALISQRAAARHYYLTDSRGSVVVSRTRLERYKIGARYYDQSTGRWTQQDPLDQAGDLREGNRYAYAGADPVNLTDPSGCGIAAYLKCIAAECGEKIVGRCNDFRGFPGVGTKLFLACVARECGGPALKCSTLLVYHPGA